MIVKFFNNDSDSWEWVDNCVVRTSRIRTLEIVEVGILDVVKGVQFGFDARETPIPANWFHYHMDKADDTGHLLTFYFTMRDQNNKEYANDKCTYVRLYDGLFKKQGIVENVQIGDIVYAHTLEIRDNKDSSVLKYTYIYAEPAGQSTWYLMNDNGNTIERLK